jgi:hypothetical protein
LASFISRAPQSSGRSDGSNRGLQFHKRCKLFIRTHNDTLPIAMRVSNPNCDATALYPQFMACRSRAAVV